MAVYERDAWIDAPLEDVWEFHSTADGLIALSPDWLHLRVERVDRPGGGSEDELPEGSEVRLSVRPAGVGPRVAWTTRIVDRERGDGRAGFRDRMVRGPLPRWEHTHHFAAEGAGTRIVDRIEYELPLGPLRGASVGARPALDRVFAHRHERAREELER